MAIRSRASSAVSKPALRLSGLKRKGRTKAGNIPWLPSLLSIIHGEYNGDPYSDVACRSLHVQLRVMPVQRAGVVAAWVGPTREHLQTLRCLAQKPNIPKRSRSQSKHRWQRSRIDNAVSLDARLKNNQPSLQTTQQGRFGQPGASFFFCRSPPYRAPMSAVIDSKMLKTQSLHTLSMECPPGIFVRTTLRTIRINSGLAACRRAARRLR